MSTFFMHCATLYGRLGAAAQDAQAAKGRNIVKSKLNQEYIDKQTVNPSFAYEKSVPARAVDGRGRRSSDCGDTIEFFINIKNDTLTDVRFQIKGCNNTLTAAHAAATLVHGKPIKEAMRLSTPEEIDAAAKLPEPVKHCANLASDALKEALRNALVNSREPWRKLYRKS